jgi:RND family efflux transporter MFP subunit
MLTSRQKLYRGAVVSVPVVVVAILAISRSMARNELHDETQRAAIPTVSVVHASPALGTGLTIPGRLQAWNQAPVYARTSGYLRKWYVDIGSQVKAGQVMADIDAPDLDQQLKQAQGLLGTSQANEKLAEVTAKRYLALKAQNAVALELVDQQVSAWDADRAATAAALANVRQLEAQESFKKLIAPFDGVVTTRSTDIGSLIVGGAINPTPLFTVSDTRRLRLYASVPQINIAAVRIGADIDFTVPELSGQVFKTTITSTTADSIDPTSGAMLLQVEVDNDKGLLKPGEYADVQIKVPNSTAAVQIPPSALLFRREGTAVALAHSDGTIEIRPIQIERDTGAALEIASGLSPLDAIVDSPPDGLRSGEKVNIVSAGQAKATQHS